MNAPAVRPGAFLGADDCERPRDAWLAQPSNALSSLAYVVAGGALVRRSLRRGDDALAAVYGGAVATNGAGGMAYHGPGGPVGLWVHDVALISTMATMATVNIQALASGRRTAAPALAVTAAAGAVIAVAPQLSRRIQNIGVGLIAATEMLRAATPSRRATSSVRSLTPVLALGAAGAVHAASRTGARWCDPDAVVQGHAVWHALSAGVLWWWGLDRT